MPHDPKPRPNHERYLQVLRRLSPADRLRRVDELTEASRSLFKAGLRHRFPELSDAELHRLYLERLALCHYSNF